MDTFRITCPTDMHRQLLAHLLPSDPQAEEAGFAFARVDREGGIDFQVLEFFPVPGDGFVHQSLGHIELTDGTRARVIKRAHDLKASVVEFHSHPYPFPARFSPTDMSGFDEFVPHVHWRLNGVPYAAVVVAPKSFDALVWDLDPRKPMPLTHMVVGERMLRPTQLTLPKRRINHG